jgi:hypothetical protein
VGRAAFKKGSIPRSVAMSSHSPHASRPSTFRAPGWGAPALPSSCCLLEEHDFAGVGALQPSLGFIASGVPPALRASGSLALMAGSCPPCGDMNEGLPAVAFALGPSLLLSCHPRRRSLPRCWCSGRRRATQSLLSRRPSGVEVVHTRGSGTGVPFVMVP